MKTDVLAGRDGLLLSNIFFIRLKEKGRAEVSKAPSCSPCQQYDRNVSWKLNVLHCAHTPDIAPIKSIENVHSCLVFGLLHSMIVFLIYVLLASKILIQQKCKYLNYMIMS